MCNQKYKKYKNLSVAPIKFTDTYAHAVLIKKDTENPLDVLTIHKNMNNHVMSYNNCNMSIYNEDELVGFIYGEMLDVHIVRTYFFWFKNSKYAVIASGIFILMTNCKIWYPNTVYTSSKWYKIYSLFLNKNLKNHSAKYTFSEEDIEQVKNVLNRMNITFNIADNFKWALV